MSEWRQQQYERLQFDAMRQAQMMTGLSPDPLRARYANHLPEYGAYENSQKAKTNPLLLLCED